MVFINSPINFSAAGDRVSFLLLRYISPSLTILRMTLIVFLITAIDPSRSLRMTFNVFLTITANPLLMFRMTPNGNHMLQLLTHS